MRANDACVSGQAPQSISCGATICGTIDGTYTSGVWSGDRDAYLFTATDTNGDGIVRVTLRLAAEFSAFAALVPMDCPVVLATAPLYVNASNCLQSSAFACVPPGQYRVIVAPGAFPTVGLGAALPCSTDPRYALTVECSQVSCAGPCSPTSGSCFSAHANPGCDDSQCCQNVCAIDPFCCSITWDIHCVSEAGQNCGLTPPANDECVNATPIQTGETLQFNTVAATVSVPSIPAGCEEGGGLNIGPDIWFKYVATCGGNLTINTCGSATDLRLAVYTGPCETLTLVSCNTDSVICTPAGGARVQFQATCGVTYFIRVGGDTPRDLGEGQINVTCPGPNCPGNCPADLNHSGLVDGADLGQLLGAWGAIGGLGPADLNHDGVVDGADLGQLLGAWGPCP